MRLWFRLLAVALIAVGTAVSAPLSTPAVAQDAKPTQEDAKSITLKAADLIAAQGLDEAAKAFNAEGPFKHGEIYVNVIDFAGVWKVYPPRPAGVGQSVINVKDPDGRFIVLEEGFDGFLESRRHQALLFARDPLLGDQPVQFAFAGDAAFSPTDMAQLPDGRVLILMRRLIWPFPLRFSGRIMIADPAAIRPGGVWRASEVAKLDAPLPVDNFEGIAIQPHSPDDRKDGQVTVWLISDNNNAATQRTLLWKLVLHPARLPQTRKGAGDAPAPSRK